MALFGDGPWLPLPMPLLAPVPADERLRRALQLLWGLLLYGLSAGLLIEAKLGIDPWDVLHQGVSHHTGISIGKVTIGVGVLVLLGWIPLKQRPGLGTIANAIVIGIAMDFALDLLPQPDDMAVRVVFMGLGVVLSGLATGLYIGAGMGPGPRDGLMTGIAARGHSIRVVRTGLEVTVLALGWILGGNVGVGTVTYALLIGPIAHVTIPAFTIGGAEPIGPHDAHTSIP
jgi:uncharacterized membrane protein YczE